MRFLGLWVRRGAQASPCSHDSLPEEVGEAIPRRAVPSFSPSGRSFVERSGRSRLEWGLTAFRTRRGRPQAWMVLTLFCSCRIG